MHFSQLSEGYDFCLNIFAARREMAKQSTQIRVCEAQNSDEEVKYILKEGKNAVNNGYTVGVLIPTGKAIIAFVNSALRQEGKSEWTPTTNRWGGIDFSDLNDHFNRCGFTGTVWADEAENLTALDRNRKIVDGFGFAFGISFADVFQFEHKIASVSVGDVS